MLKIPAIYVEVGIACDTAVTNVNKNEPTVSKV
jgi:hypothetical protein